MKIFKKLNYIWEKINYPFFQNIDGEELFFSDLTDIEIEGINNVKEGDVVALIGDFDPESIATLLFLIEKKAIIVPLTKETKEQHEYFLKESFTKFVFEKNKLIKTLSNNSNKNPYIEKLRLLNNPGLILFTTGTTGKPKAILHDFLPFFERYKTPRPPLKALSFLLFDHIGGLNTLFHMLFNQGQVVAIKKRSVESVINAINKYSIELLPTTPTFLRMISLYPDVENKISSSLKIISYGTERMDQPTLDRLCKQFPDVDFRQTYGMSELGILRIKSKSRNSLYMKIGGEGVELKVIDEILYVKAKNKMIGYLNAKSPFDKNGWYCTKDIVECKEKDYFKITGRDSDTLNIGGLKFMPSEVEVECLKNPKIKQAKAYGKENPITGQHLELILEVEEANKSTNLKKLIMEELKEKLPRYMLPSKIIFKSLNLSHRFKKL